MATMNRRYLEVTFRQGKPVAAYLYLSRRPGDHSDATRKFREGLVVDFASDGRPIGIEITAPTRLSLAALNAVLSELREQPVSDDEVAPLAA